MMTCASRDNEPSDRARLERWRLHKAACGRARLVVCHSSPHTLGWELTLIIDGGDPVQSHVCRSEAELDEMSSQWRAAMADRGWA
jgi:hypothetical protein